MAAPPGRRATLRLPARLKLPQARWRRPSRAQARRAGGFAVLVIAIALLSWQTLPLEPTVGLPSATDVGLDASWQVALQMAHYQNVSFGNHFIFTYGPLGFLSIPTLWYRQAGVLAFLYGAAGRIVLVIALLAGARRTYGLVIGSIVALLVASASTGVIDGFSDGVLEAVPFLVLSVWIVDRLPDDRRLTILLLVGGAIAGLELLNKESTGIELAGLAVVTACAARGRRRHHLLATVAGLLVGALAGWTAAGQNWGELPAYISGTEQIVSGYPAAMSDADASLNWQYIAAWASFAFGIVAALRMTAGADARRRWGVVALWVVFCFFEFKEGFVRHDPIHGLIYFVAVMGGFLGLTWPRRYRPVAFALTAALFLFAINAEGTSFSGVFQPGPDASSAITQIGQVLSRSESLALTAAGREEAQTAFPIDPGTLALLRGHTVQVSPYAAAVAWAYDLDWRPLPVFQSYSAYTSALDQDNANVLSSTYAPQRILRDLEPAIDGRFLTFDQPLTNRTMLCRYRQLRATAAWQVLAATANRCGSAVLLSTVRAGWNQPVRVPKPPNVHSFVFVRIGGIGVGPLERLAEIFATPPERTIAMNGTVYRLVEGTAEDGLLLDVPPDIDYPPPFGLAPNPKKIAIREAGESRARTRTHPITFSFFIQYVRPWAGQDNR